MECPEGALLTVDRDGWGRGQEREVEEPLLSMAVRGVWGRPPPQQPGPSAGSQAVRGPGAGSAFSVPAARLAPGPGSASFNRSFSASSS